MTQQNLITVRDYLRDAYKQLQPGTILHVDELTNERRTDPIDADGTDLRKVSLCTADGELYSIRNGVPTLSMTRGDVNPVLRRIDDAFDQLTSARGNFRPSREEVEQALGSNDAVHVDLTKLRLQEDYFGGQYLIIPTKKEHGLRPEEEKLAWRVFGEATFKENMEMFREAGISESRIYILTPAYVRRHASESALGRLSYLDTFNVHSNFIADGQGINYRSHLRGYARNK